DRLMLRALLIGGDRLHYRKQGSLPFELINHYGPTENSVVSTCAEVVTASSDASAPPIGRPIANTEVYLLDRNLQPVPLGVTGELLIGGDGLARCYLNDPDLTAEKFIPNPFSEAPGARLYKTGDLARYLADGNLEFLGRIDYQVKIRGFRIELGEIEVALSQHPAVREVAVMAHEDSPGDKRLVAYVVPQDGQADALTDLRGFLKQSLPEYMVPSAFVTLERLPLTPNGKVDRKALPAPERTVFDEAAYVAPRTATEEILAGIWAEVLGLERVGINDNFFKQGGHSLLAVSVIERDRRAGLHVDVRTLFVTPTLAGLAAAGGGGSGAA